MQRQQQDTTRANKIEQGNQHPVDSSSDDEYIFSLGNIKTHAIKSKVKSPKVHVKIRNMPTEIMIDTGASADISDEHALLRIQKYSRKINQPPPPLLYVRQTQRYTDTARKHLCLSLENLTSK